MDECKHGNTGYCALCNCEDEEHDAAMAAQAADDRDELDTLREAYAAAKMDAELLAWVLAHPETAAECLEDAVAGDGTARGNLEFRRDALAGRIGAA